MTQQEYENKIKELQDELEQLKAAKIEAEQPKRWKPKCGEEYWLINEYGQIASTTYRKDEYDSWPYLTGNCFKTEEEAEEYKKKIEYTARYKNYIEEHNEPLDWNNNDQEKYHAEFNCDTGAIDPSYYRSWKIQGTICASREQIIWDAIKEIGEDNFKKYVLEDK